MGGKWEERNYPLMGTCFSGIHGGSYAELGEGKGVLGGQEGVVGRAQGEGKAEVSGGMEILSRSKGAYGVRKEIKDFCDCNPSVDVYDKWNSAIVKVYYSTTSKPY
jgi:hypothetical protein